MTRPDDIQRAVETQASLDTQRPEVLDQLDPAAHAVIEASAGTGKTFTLEHLVVDLVQRGAGIEEILVVTFTEKATREMRVRVRERLRAASADPRVRAALGQFDRAPISTIHGFCQRLLVEQAFASGQLFEQERVDGRAAFHAALVHVMRNADGGVLAVLGAALESLSQDELEECLFAYHRETCPVHPRASLDDVRAALAAVPEGIDVEDAVSFAHALSRPRVREHLPPFLALARASREEPMQALLPRLLAWALVTEGRKKAADRTIPYLSKALEAHPTLAAPLRALVPVIGSTVPLVVHVVLPAVRARLAEQKRAQGLFDYDDLLALVLDALRSPRGEDVVRAVRGRYRHALVDEFQDTDERQWEIFRRLFVDPLDVRGPSGEPRVPTITVIGDPKQAIYAFRGADVHTYRRACDALLAGGARQAVLDRSFRSSAALLEGLHAILAPPNESFFSGPVRYEHPVRAARPALGAVDARGAPVPAVRLMHLVSPNGDPPRAKALRRTLASAYAAEIASLLDGAVRVVDEAGTHTLTASDVFVLTRTAAEGDEIGEALRARGLPYAFFRKDGLFATDEAKDVLDVLRALVAPRDRRARVRALATPFFAVPLDVLGEARELAPEHPLIVLFDRLVTLSQQRELAPLFRALVEDTGLSRRELYLHASERRLTNYLHLLEVLVGLSHRGRLSLRDLAERLAELVHGRARPSEDEDIQRLPSEQDAVQILTIHKAKGLEAHAVFLFGGLGQRPPSERVPAVMHGPRGASPERGLPAGRYAWAGPMPDEERTRFAQEEDQEAQRLYYVALTRARSLLYLPYVGPRPGEPPRDAKLKGPFRVVHARLEALVRDPLPPEILRREVEIERAARAPSRVLDRPAPRTTMPDARVARLPQGAASTLRYALMGPEITSYSRMKSRALAERTREAAVEEDRVELLGLEAPEPPPAADDPLPGGTTLGVAVHEILERLPLDPIRAGDPEALVHEPALRAVAAEALARQALDAALVEPALALALRALRTPIAVPGLLLPFGLATPAQRMVEASFLHPIPERPGVSPLSRGLVRGVVDLLFEHEGRLWVLDWKTDRLADYAPAAVTAHVHEHYEVQVRLYALACARLFALRTEAAHEARFGGLLYVFLRGLDAAGAGLAALRPSFADLARWEEELASESAPWGYPLPLRRGDALAAPVPLPEIGGAR